MNRLFLSEGKNITLPERTQPFNPLEFYQTRQGLVVYDDFRNLILPAAKTVESVPAIEIASFNIIRETSDAEIWREELPEDHVFEDISDFCCYLAGMIELQKYGRKGDLLTNGYPNIAYVYGISREIFTIEVFSTPKYQWYVIPKHVWCVGARRFSNSRRFKGYLVLSRSCPAGCLV